MMNRFLKGIMIGIVLYALYLLFGKQIQLFIVIHNLEILASFLKFMFYYIVMIYAIIFIADKIE